ncbi:DUF624 domain-containing protein [Bacillus sp. FJAT-42376]|uniref:YesL family protein n=1 Tax=Bacillus sp. FJAT-42376 TaxID=2014076 RepID=UPI000F4FA074|nr:DUF624 domain-containing protein [Bacillus sp. FJAT-42376]AZB43754.1 DUF624 domain-containing protein [Bacillus sp. FJAT-42376]
MGGISGKLLELCDWGARLAWLNILWLMHTFAGGIFLGVFPATAAAHHTIRSMFKGEEQKIGSVFRSYYRKEWKNANKLGYVTFSIGAVLYIDYSFFRMFSSIYALLASYLCFIIFVLWLFGWVTVFSLYVNFEMKSLAGYLKNALYLLLGYPATFFLLTAGLILIGAVFFFIPGLLPFYAVSVPVCFIEWACGRRFHRLQASRAG